MEENKKLSEAALDQVSGGKSDEYEWKFREEVKINSTKQNCPDCGNRGFTLVDRSPALGYDVFSCTCGQYFQHVFNGDKWYRAYKKAK